MKLLKLEFRLLKIDLFKLSLIIFVISILNDMLLSLDKIISFKITTSYVLMALFGSAGNLPLGWINWILICMGYLIILQIIWKSKLHMVSVYQILRYKNLRLYWQTKFVTGLLITLCYVLVLLATTFIISILFNARIIWDFQWLVVFLCLSLNMYIHALLWLTIKLYSTVEVAIIILCLLIYTGARIIKPYILLYYGMRDQIKQFLPLVFFVELFAIFVLFNLIVMKAKKMDLS
ncbi:hypothetical protein PU629_00410 [Pullulanibacillus sp. KACC 23026]|uniref:hypothetical protein n=1 Tax=Pullulanibacillus sp. KACC 23026 TaxID=3028315 RepID=UPI0023B159D8|nr:hypothetical protein [Pullulanibacillus sp. KACC 23026]WEG12851.1 hypothetical protein PU629_00410 [Pullulanibacillus sp. KACC 23026]